MLLKNSLLILALLFTNDLYSQIRVRFGIPNVLLIDFDSKPIQLGIAADLEYCINEQWFAGLEFTKETPGSANQNAKAYGLRITRALFPKDESIDSRNIFALEVTTSFYFHRRIRSNSIETRLYCSGVSVTPSLKLNDMFSIYLSTGIAIGFYGKNYRIGVSNYELLSPRFINVGITTTF